MTVTKSSPKDELQASAETVHEFAEEIVEWYWNFGSKRTGRYSWSLGNHLDRLYSAAEISKAILMAQRSRKPTSAIWGPSQSGKSTLLSQSIDRATSDGSMISALQWNCKKPFRFLACDISGKQIPGLNPFNAKKDASGCITRFRLANDSDIRDKNHPVEVKFQSNRQIMLAIAIGYATRCQKSSSRPAVWDLARLEKRLKANQGRTVRRDVFEAMYAFADVLDLLIQQGYLPFQNLTSEDPTDIRRRLLAHVPELTSIEGVGQLAAEMLWDSNPALTELFESLCRQRQAVCDSLRERPLYCSLETASWLVDMDRYQKLQSRDSTSGQIQHLGILDSGTHCLLTTESTQSLCATDSDFATLQAIVLELVVPLRKETLAETAKEVHEFLEASDLLDLPGASTRYMERTHGEDTNVLKIDECRWNDPKVFTDVLKSGKITSLITTYSREFTIDTFSLLARIGAPVAKPDELRTGVKTWLRAWDPSVVLGRNRSPLPFNLVMTFCSEAFKTFERVQNGDATAAQGLAHYLDQLASLADPAFLWNTVMTNYPHLPDGEWDCDDHRKKEFIDMVIARPEFKKQLKSAESLESAKWMVADGGISHFLRILTTQSKSACRLDHLSRRSESCRESLGRMIVENGPRPPTNKQECFGNWRSMIETILQSPEKNHIPAIRSIYPSTMQVMDRLTELSSSLRDFLNVDPQDLDPIPLGILKANLRLYIETQFNTWSRKKGERILSSPHGLARLGLTTEQQMHAILEAFTSPTNIQAVSSWLIGLNLRFDQPQEAERARFFLAIRMANEIFPDAALVPEHRPMTKVEQALELMEPGPGRKLKPPHVARFLGRLRSWILTLAESAEYSTRPPQPGDAELVELARRFQVTVHSSAQ